jgi:hypothetical protein
MAAVKPDIPQGDLGRLILIVVSECTKEVSDDLVESPVAPKGDGGAT